jgi:hypothetical protein
VKRGRKPSTSPSLCDDEPAYRFNEALPKSGAARRERAGGWDRSWQSCRDLGAVCPKPPGVATNVVVRPSQLITEKSVILCHRPRKQLEFYSTRRPRSLIPSSKYHHAHVTSPCLGARGEGFIGGRSWKGGESGLRSQAPSKVTGQFPRALSVERPIRNANEGDSSHCSAPIRDPDFAQGRQTDTSHIHCPLESWNRS